MVEMRQAEYAALVQKAHDILMDRALPVDSPKSLELVVQLLVEPAFRNHTSWTIFAEKGRSMRLVRQVSWDKVFDSGRFHDPLKGLQHGWHTNPTVITKIATLDAVWLDSLLEEGYKYATIEPQNGIGLDGVRWSIYMPRFFEGRTIQWNLVQGNDELVEWTKKLADSLKHVLKTA